MTDHPITPPPELVQQWYDNIGPDPGPFESFAIAAARWGADQELEACCKWLRNRSTLTESLRTARRPEPPSLKERALQAWAAVEAGTDDQTAMAVIRRALEALPND